MSRKIRFFCPPLTEKGVCGKIFTALKKETFNMEIKYYGTGAGAGIPEIFCDCPVCRHAREFGKKDIRTRSQAVIDGVLSIDYPVDTFLHTAFYGLDMRKVKNVIITHDHHDHYFPTDLFSRAHGMTEPVTFWCSAPTAKGLKEAIYRREEPFRTGKRIKTNEVLVAAKELEFFIPVKIADYTVTPLRAFHKDPGNAAMNFIISSEGKNILWAHDTGKFTEDTVEYIKNSGVVFDFVSLDCTLKRGEQITPRHMDLDWCIEMTELLRKNGNVNNETVIVLSHIGHLVERTHEQLSAEAAPYGMTVAYDGMTVKI